jgi:phosphoglycolate phosphatase
MSRGTIIFDFDGTLADSFQLVSSFIATQAGKTNLTPAERNHLKGLSMRDIAKELEVPSWRYLWMFFEGRRMMSGRMDEVKPFVGVTSAVRVLRAQGWDLYVLSSNSNSNIQLFLKRYELEKYFVRTQGSASFFGKTQALRTILRRNKLDPRQSFYVGDEARDLYAARRSNIRGVAVAWGYNNLKTLAAEKPFAAAKTPADLNKIFTEK